MSTQGKKPKEKFPIGEKGKARHQILTRRLCDLKREGLVHVSEMRDQEKSSSGKIVSTQPASEVMVLMSICQNADFLGLECKPTRGKLTETHQWH
ncbi:MAG: hypothetical protein CM15mP46_4510 [Alphaproteobacteria bacterium]|nr:MAG: hypothetical protein CM15mP46_4510 [Alphaproteobacteria bacterium]